MKPNELQTGLLHMYKPHLTFMLANWFQSVDLVVNGNDLPILHARNTSLLCLPVLTAIMLGNGSQIRHPTSGNIIRAIGVEDPTKRRLASAHTHMTE